MLRARRPSLDLSHEFAGRRLGRGDGVGGVCLPARRRARRRGSARSFRLSPMSVIPRIARTMAMPGGIAVHQMPADTSPIDSLRS